jgi:hypothetical protein
MTLRLYRALIRLLPREVRERDGEEMARALADRIAGAPVPSAVRWRALIRFPLVLALEWRDALLAGRVPAPPVPSRGGRMESAARMIRQGARALARTPAFSLSVVLLLGVGATLQLDSRAPGGPDQSDRVTPGRVVGQRKRTSPLRALRNRAPAGRSAVTAPLYCIARPESTRAAMHKPATIAKESVR